MLRNFDYFEILPCMVRYFVPAIELKPIFGVNDPETRLKPPQTLCQKLNLQSSCSSFYHTWYDVIISNSRNYEFMNRI